jgi:hypothetical protein
MQRVDLPVPPFWLAKVIARINFSPSRLRPTLHVKTTANRRQDNIQNGRALGIEVPRVALYRRRSNRISWKCPLMTQRGHTSALHASNSVRYDDFSVEDINEVTS